MGAPDSGGTCPLTIMSEPNKQRMIPLHLADQAVAACNKDIAELQAQVERLRAAGDVMAARLLYQGYPETVQAWEAAKKL